MRESITGFSHFTKSHTFHVKWNPRTMKNLVESLVQYSRNLQKKVIFSPWRFFFWKSISWESWLVCIVYVIRNLFQTKFLPLWVRQFSGNQWIDRIRLYRYVNCVPIILIAHIEKEPLENILFFYVFVIAWNFFYFFLRFWNQKMETISDGFPLESFKEW